MANNNGKHKMKIEIKSRFIGEVLFAHEAEENSIKITLKAALQADANLRGANLYGANLRGANLYGANLYGADLYGADLYGANLRGADLRGADLRGANLRGANLRGANLRGADLYGADLRGADLRGANLRGADLRGANLRGANLYGDKLTKTPLFLYNLTWDVTITTTFLRIGCQVHLISDWASFSDDRISEMSSAALEFWRKYKSAIMALCEAHKAD
jgi:uncharacterized protein YjbI with pentapeptide repeats